MAGALSNRRAGLLAGVACAIAAWLLAQSHDVSVTGVTAPSGGTVGTPLSVTVSVFAPAGASGVTVTAIFQPAVTFDAWSSSANCVANAAAGDTSTTVTCPAAGLSAVRITVSPRQSGPLNVVAGVIGNEADPAMSNNSWRGTIAVSAAATATPTPTSAPPSPTYTPTRTPNMTATPTPTPQPAANGAAFVSQSVPASVVAGASFSATVTMKNTGTTTWTRAGSYRLGSLSSGDPWGSRVELESTVSIAPGQQKSFAVAADAPQAAGTYSFQWRMVEELFGWFGSASPTVYVTVTAAPLTAYSVPQCRVIDTRNPAGPNGGPGLSAGETRLFALRGSCGVPSTARAAMLNVAALWPASDGFLVFYPPNGPRPATSSLNYRAGAMRSNNQIVTLDSAGRMAAFANQATGSVHLIVDVTGYLQ